MLGFGGGGEEERKRKYFRKAEQSKDILIKHQDAIEKTVRRWQTDLCVVSDENSSHENHKLCCVLQAQLHIGYMSHHSQAVHFIATQSHACNENRCSVLHTQRPSNPQTNKLARLARM